MDQILVSVCFPPQNKHIDIKKVANSHVGVTLKDVKTPKKHHLAEKIFIYVKAPMHINSHTKFQLPL